MENSKLNAALERFINLPDNPYPCIEVADIYYDLNQYGAALSYYLRAAELADSNDVAYYCLLRNALMLRKQGKREGTFKNQVLHAIALCPTRPEAYLLMCRFYEEKGINHDCNTLATIALTVCSSIDLDTPRLEDLDYPGRYALEFYKGVSAYRIAKFAESREIFTALRDLPDMTPEYRRAVDINLDFLKIPRNMDNIDFQEEYRIAYTTPSDINEHLHMLHALALDCEHVTEMGVRHGMSTIAFMAAGKKLVSYDLEKDEKLDQLFKVYPLGDYIEANVLETEIAETDLLFIDTWHHYEQLKQELKLHAGKVRKYIAMHDTHTFGVTGENMPIGLIPAMLEFLMANPEWSVMYHSYKNNGLTVLKKKADENTGNRNSSRKRGTLVAASSK